MALPLPADLRAELARLEARHNTALDWDDPAAPSPWTDDERRAFDAEACALAARLSTALGATVDYLP
ncbi:hypothetical protein [Wenxinia marina]|uniref:Uncharacterized protein n=1 Tax=Wenxinia marina DSM 24838 TaxID=1123501 RepID=A0A0D0QBQ4_9RHOB|nr:hypothetical protein [Wenxinia marina]KIQ69687.1 hypothetical protein Wenmar_02051 [Wenxinia marina DSM 24838]GGL60368.1 hypothetical protein GCM10011392_13580 [Wenxinia marina]